VGGNSNALQFWGKAGGARQGEPAWHPLAYHSLDVAAVADALLKSNPRKLAVMADLLGTDAANAHRFIVCLVALHDVGKFTTHFQAKCEEAWNEGVRHFLGDWHPLHGNRHDLDGYIMREVLAVWDLLQPATQDWSEVHFNRLWAAVTGHHGRPANDDSCPTSIVPGVNAACRNAAGDFCRAVRNLFDPLEAIPRPSERNLAVLSWLLCGLTVVADWVGSNRESGWFPYRAPTLDLPGYWKEAQSKALMAVAEAGLSPSPVPPETSVSRLFPHLAGRLSPLQHQVLEMKLPDGPMLAVIEDVTGSGKTEAALILAARLLAERRAGGLYFALPTMATANAMYDRLQHAYRRIFAEGARPSLVLSHGRRMLNEAFSASVLAPDPTPEGYEDGGSAACAAWIADDRRRAFLGEIGVGTIDQALLGALPSRHQALRLWGLSERVLIVDEAHAYDTYMNRELEVLLTFQAALGGSAIVLSATLPDTQRHKLMKAFTRGLGCACDDAADSHYPLLTTVSKSGCTTEPVGTRGDRIRNLPVRRIGTLDEALDEITGVANRGGAVAWIRNAVDDAIEAAESLRSRGLRPVLLHARFAMGDRLDIEDRVRTTLGREDRDGARKGYVLVGTQILEQSLDYDVDAMITDLAPIDLMIQRAGRLWRHERNHRPLAAPELVVMSPDPGNVEDENWYRLLSARAAAVYSHHGIVWRSAKTLFDTGAIRTPQDVRRLIEKVYGTDDLDDIPKALRRASQTAMGEAGAARSFANANLLKPEEGYGGAIDLWMRDTITPTRLGDPVTVFRLGRLENGRIVPWCPDQHLTRAWALSEISISQKKADGVPPPAGQMEARIAEAKECWPQWERQVPLLVLEQEPGDGDTWRGVVSHGEAHHLVSYDRSIGLRMGETVD